MGNSRESSPDWLHTFQAPTQSITTLSSDSELSGDQSPIRDDSVDLQKNLKHRKSSLLEGESEEEDEDDKIISGLFKKSHTKKAPDSEFPGDQSPLREEDSEEDDEDDKIISDLFKKSHTKKSPNKKSPKKRAKTGDGTPSKRIKSERQEKGNEDDENVKREEDFDKSTGPSARAPNHSVYDLSSDSELYSVATIRQKEEKDNDEESALRSKTKGKSPKKQIKDEDIETIENKKANKPLKVEGEVGNVDVAEDGKREKISSSMLPLVLPDKVHRSKALVECEGESIDLGGDMGSVGRVIISETPSRESEMFLDLKGTIYKTVIVPSRTFCVVSVGQSEAKIEAIMNDYIQLIPQSNVYDAETMVEGTLEGFTFDSDDEAYKMAKEVKGDPSEGFKEQPNKKMKGKAEKKSVATNKRGKDGGKQTKKLKPQASKKGRPRSKI